MAPPRSSDLTIALVLLLFGALGVDAAIRQPSNFYQNDFWFKDTIPQHGIYPQPLGDIGVSPR